MVALEVPPEQLAQDMRHSPASSSYRAGMQRTCLEVRLARAAGCAAAVGGQPSPVGHIAGLLISDDLARPCA
jgi:hypothetical protein